MNKWDARFMALAQLLASWSKDPSTGVGAVIVDEEQRVVSVGFNGFPRGCSDDAELLQDREERLRRTIHAEENALLFARSAVKGCTLYATHHPCARCAAKIAQSGISRVVTRMPLGGFALRWAEDVNSTTEIFAESGITTTIIQEGNEE
jgi:dCMP deaminase